MFIALMASYLQAILNKNLEHKKLFLCLFYEIS